MPHIHTGSGHHDLTVSAYIVRIDGPQPTILLHHHKKLKVWMQVGGHVELHETPWTAVQHEIREESGYDISQLSILQPDTTLTDLDDTSVAHPLPFLFATHPYGNQDHFHTDAAFVFTTKESPRYGLDKEESDQLAYLTRKEILNFPQEQMMTNVRKAILYIFDHLLDSWRPVDTLRFK